MRDQGSKVDCDIGVYELPRLPRLIAWRLPEEGEQERGTSWLADT